MASKIVCAIYDAKTCIYKHPFMGLTKGAAIRTFIDVVNDEGSEICRHPEDFTLFHIADYEETTGDYNIKTPHDSLGTGVEYKKEAK
ncbi:MAG: nonstructural protein [Arizlama microvirus]|nr:MAG: nonstructural protein [Arizlama microvirus]